MISKVSREKILRVAFSIFKNLVENANETIEYMVDGGIIKVIDTAIK